MPTLVIGDIHGHYERLVELLRDDAHLIDPSLNWIGRDAQLWFVGDFFNRGPDGVSAVDLFIRLQEQAGVYGGRVQAIIGNHDVLVLAAKRFGKSRITDASRIFFIEWRSNGGVQSDLDRLTSTHMAWLANLPAMQIAGDRLFVHADAWFYVKYGTSVEAVNAAFADVLNSDHPEQWDALLDAFGEHQTFARDEGTQKAHKFLRIFGGRQIIHGHTPISKMTAQDPRNVSNPLIYAVNRCVNVDGGMYLGGSGFIHELAPL
jgi:hypothetical protein